MNAHYTVKNEGKIIAQFQFFTDAVGFWSLSPNNYSIHPLTEFAENFMKEFAGSEFEYAPKHLKVAVTRWKFI